MNNGGYQILVTIGTDHHKFDRVINWLDDWLDDHPSYREVCLVQHGQTAPSKLAKNIPFIPFPRLMELMSSVRVVITHGGPASIFESRNNSRIPLCVPRVPELNEIVDDHQVRFARYLARENLIFLCEDESAFTSVLENALTDPNFALVKEQARRNRATIDNLEALINELSAGVRSSAPGWFERLVFRA